VLRSRVAWDRLAADYAGPGLRNWTAAEPGWGVWKVPEAQLGVLPPVLAGTDSLELGCGTAYISAWLARRGARPAGLDNSVAQLATAAALQDRLGLHFPLIHASAEQIPLADAAFDLVISTFGMHRFQWTGSDAVDFHIGHGDMIRLLRRCGFEICDLIEVQPPPGSTTRHPVASLEWTRKWPCEEVWKARKSP
jgi:SAM-dependent methyltransferase